LSQRWIPISSIGRVSDSSRKEWQQEPKATCEQLTSSPKPRFQEFQQSTASSTQLEQDKALAELFLSTRAISAERAFSGERAISEERTISEEYWTFSIYAKSLVLFPNRTSTNNDTTSSTFQRDRYKPLISLQSLRQASADIVRHAREYIWGGRLFGDI